MSEQSNHENQSTAQQPQRRSMTEKERLEALKKRDLAFKRKQQMLKDASPEERDRMRKNAERHYQAKVEEKANKTAPTGFWKHWDNYWYHYKTYTIIGAILVILVVWVGYSLVTKEKYDIDMMLLTASNETSTSEECKALGETLSQYVLTDLNRDGKKNVGIELFVYGSEGKIEGNSFSDSNQNALAGVNGTTDYQQAMQGRLMYSFGEGGNLVYLMDPEMYEYTTAGLGVEYIDLSAYTDSDLVDGDRYYIEDDSDFANMENREGLVLVVRELSNMKDGDKKSMIKRHANELEIVKEIIKEP